MSQTETLLLIVLGFSLAALIALFIGRFMWSLAIRLGSRRMQRQVPATVAELHTERNQLRAEYALLSQKLGTRLEGVKAQMAEQMAEVTRTRNRIATLVTELNEKDATLTAREQDSAGLRTRVSGLEADAVEAQAALSALRQELDRKSNEIRELHKAIGDRDAHIATLAPPPEVILAVSDPEATEDRLKRRIEDLTALSQQIAHTRDQAVDGSAAADPLLQQQIEQAALETEDLQEELARLDAAWTGQLGELETRDVAPQTPGNPPPKPRAIANVISLANRIRSLKKDIAG